MEYNGVQQRVREWELDQLSVGNSHGKLGVKEELENNLWRLSVWLEDLATVRLLKFRYQGTNSEDWES
jgi:hypothetical protein